LGLGGFQFCGRGMFWGLGVFNSVDGCNAKELDLSRLTHQLYALGYHPLEYHKWRYRFVPLRILYGLKKALIFVQRFLYNYWISENGSNYKGNLREK